MLVPLKLELIVLIFDGGMGGAGVAGGTTPGRLVVGVPEARNELCTPVDATEVYAAPLFGFGAVEEDPARNLGVFREAPRPCVGSNAFRERVCGALGPPGRSESAGRLVPGSARLTSTATNCRIPSPMSRRNCRVFAACGRTKQPILCSFDAPISVTITLTWSEIQFVFSTI